MQYIMRNLLLWHLHRDQFKSLVVKMYRSYVQEDSTLTSKAAPQDKKINMEDPQQVTLTYIHYIYYLHTYVHP